mgnify:FL=1
MRYLVVVVVVALGVVVTGVVAVVGIGQSCGHSNAASSCNLIKKLSDLCSVNIFTKLAMYSLLTSVQHL